jgi:galactitol-specific phosphotransferase system IIB component
MAIKTIACCCGMGMGTSLLAKMNVEKALGNLGIRGVSVEHCTLSEAPRRMASIQIELTRLTMGASLASLSRSRGSSAG